jgi:hypothetical protein
MGANSMFVIALRRHSTARAAMSNRCLACSRKRSGSVRLRLVHETSTGGGSSGSCPYQIGDGLSVSTISHFTRRTQPRTRRSLQF